MSDIMKEDDARLKALEQREPIIQVMQSTKPVQLTVLTQSAEVHQTVGPYQVEGVLFPELGGVARAQVEELPASNVALPLQAAQPAEPDSRSLSAQLRTEGAPEQAQEPPVFPLDETPPDLSEWRYRFHQARIAENEGIESKLDYLYSQIQKLKAEIITMKRDEGVF
jgi:nucleoid-associated protein YgaU